VHTHSDRRPATHIVSWLTIRTCCHSNKSVLIAFLFANKQNPLLYKIRYVSVTKSITESVSFALQNPLLFRCNNTQTQNQTHSNSNICIYITYTNLDVYRHTCTRACAHTHTHLYVYIHIHAQITIYTVIRARVHTHTRIHLSNMCADHVG
jgi:hypothetical protein